nr:ubiquitin carboxyl-terminal hydrolase 23-like [Ipomoea batatas]
MTGLLFKGMHKVFQVNERKVLEQKAYMLFYVRDRKKSQLVKISSSTSLGNKFDVGETIGLKDLKQSGLMNMLTRGLEETTVVSWDCKPISPLDDVTESGNECVKIGYIGDEWTSSTAEIQIRERQTTVPSGAWKMREVEEGAIGINCSDKSTATEIKLNHLARGLITRNSIPQAAINITIPRNSFWIGILDSFIVFLESGNQDTII